MPQLSIVGFNIVCSVLGGFIALFGLVSFLFKEKFYLSETRKSSLLMFDYSVWSFADFFLPK
jgi:hypothetical protein